MPVAYFRFKICISLDKKTKEVQVCVYVTCWLSSDRPAKNIRIKVYWDESLSLGAKVLSV